jgi:hypothetical protein
MKRILGVALLALPFAAGPSHAEGWPFNIQAGGSFYIKGSNGTCPQAGPWYLYWPLEAHFVAPAPTGYPYWPAQQGIMATNFGGPACPPGVPVAAAPQAANAPQAAAAPQAAYPPQAAYAPQSAYPPQARYAPPTGYAPQATSAPQAMSVPQAMYPPQVMSMPAGVTPPTISTIPPTMTPTPQTVPQATPQLRLPPYLQPTSYFPTGSLGQPPSYWYDR